MFSCYRKYSQF